MDAIIDYNILTYSGNIAYYNSCEITQLFLHKKNGKENLNFYTLATFEAKPFEERNHKFLCKPISINNDCSIGIHRYWLSIEEARTTFETLSADNKWDFEGDKTLMFPKLNSLPKQYIPAFSGNRINSVLKNNFHNGAYILEFFDEEKNEFNFLLKSNAVKDLIKLSKQINKILSIDISDVADRIGNIIFQFPIAILEVDTKALSTWNGVELKFTWHENLLNPPDCLLQIESTIDNNYIGSKIEDYEKGDRQEVVIGNLTQFNHIKVWRKAPNLIVSTFDGGYIRGFDIHSEVSNSKYRYFEIDNVLTKTTVIYDRSLKNKDKPNYTSFIRKEVEKKKLEKTLAFKQYRNLSYEMALGDLRDLINKNNEYGVYLWDPFLTANDILNTLFYSNKADIEIRAIGSFSKKTQYVSKQKQKITKTITEKIIALVCRLGLGKKIKKTPLQIYLDENKKILDNPKHDNFGLNLEFRIQHSNYGWAFHDRFLIFPSGKLRGSKVYSLGTSVNSFGQNHHILQEVSHPQLIIDAFDELWNKLNTPNCIIWKYPQ